jgi:DNA modification methylase
LEHEEEYEGMDTSAVEDASRSSYSSMRRDIKDCVDSLGSRFHCRETLEYRDLVNFSTGWKYPIHRWYHYQEGYSPELVGRLLRQFNIESGDRVLDPFCGCGTTLLVAAQAGIDSVGFETNPFSAFCSKVKATKYAEADTRLLKRMIEEVEMVDFEPSIPPPQYQMIDELFDGDVLKKLLMHKEFIHGLDSISYEPVKSLLLFGWMTILERLSNYRKGGNGLKKKPRNLSTEDVIQTLLSKYRAVYDDLTGVNLSSFSHDGPSERAESEILNESSMNLHTTLGSNSVDCAIFSPPYANCFDYCEVYKIELWMGGFVRSYEDLKRLRLNSIRSHVNVRWDYSDLAEEPPAPLNMIVDFLNRQTLWNNHIPKMLQAYFLDMSNFLGSLFKALKSSGKCAIVVGNSAYGNIVIPTDLLLAQAAETKGFSCEEIRIARYNETSSQQQLKLGEFKKYLRESVIILRKQ